MSDPPSAMPPRGETCLTAPPVWLQDLHLTHLPMYTHVCTCDRRASTEVRVIRLFTDFITSPESDLAPVLCCADRLLLLMTVLSVARSQSSRCIRLHVARPIAPYWSKFALDPLEPTGRRETVVSFFSFFSYSRNTRHASEYDIRRSRFDSRYLSSE